MKSYVLYRIVPLSMTLSDPKPQFQPPGSQYSLNANISQTVHPIPSMFGSILGSIGSRLGYRGLAYQMALFPVGPNSIGMQ